MYTLATLTTASKHNFIHKQWISYHAALFFCQVLEQVSIRGRPVFWWPKEVKPERSRLPEFHCYQSHMANNKETNMRHNCNKQQRRDFCSVCLPYKTKHCGLSNLETNQIYTTTSLAHSPSSIQTTPLPRPPLLGLSPGWHAGQPASRHPQHASGSLPPSTHHSLTLSGHLACKEEFIRVWASLLHLTE